MKCPTCGAEAPEAAEYCHRCGTQMDLECPQCGATLTPGARVCVECGADLVTAADEHLQEAAEPAGLVMEQVGLPGVGQRDPLTVQITRTRSGQTTALMIDLSGLARFSDTLRQADTISLMGECIHAIVRKIHQFEGSVEEIDAHRIVSLFGPGQGAEGPEQAVRAALAIHREMSRFSSMVQSGGEASPWQVRIGISTGTSGMKPASNGTRVHLPGFAETIRLARELEQAAEPGTTYVTEQTFSLTRGTFRFEAQGALAPGRSGEQVQVYRVIAPNSARTRFDVSSEAGLTRLIGRGTELRMLREGLERAKNGRGEVFCFVGEPGVGKSRLLYEFRKTVANQNVSFLEGKCLSYGKGAAFHPIADILRSTFDLRENLPDVETAATMKRALEDIQLDVPSMLPYLLELVSVKDSGIDEIALSSEAKKAGILRTIEQIVARGSDIRPMVLAFEDLHWMDDSSGEVINRLVEITGRSRVLLLLTYRPEFLSRWGVHPHLHQMSIRRLSRQDTMAMVDLLVGTEELNRELRELVYEKTRGVPLFVEELVRSLRALHVVEARDHRCRIARNGSQLAVASTIEDVIRERINRLPEGAREVLEVGSVIEREFSHPLIALVTGLPDLELVSRLSVLRYEDLLYERGVYPDSIYVFKHALLQEVIYRYLSEDRRRECHRRIAEVMAQHFADSVATTPELLAHHLTQAGLLDRAAPYWRKAGEVAVHRSANQEAVAHLNKALKILETLPRTPARVIEELEVRLVLGPALMASRGYAAPEVEEVYARARQLCSEAGDPPSLYTVLRGLWGYYIVRGDLGVAYDLGKRCLNIALEDGNSALCLWGYYMLGMTVFHTGQIRRALEYFDKGTDLYDIQKRRSHRALQDPGVACLSYRAAALWLLGYPDQARITSTEALTLAQMLGHPFSLAYALGISALVSQLYGQVDEVQERAASSSVLCSEHGMPYWFAWGPIHAGWALVRQGKGREGIELMNQGLDAYSSTGAKLVQTYFFALAAEGYALENREGEGLAIVNQGLAMAEQTGEEWFVAELHRLKGELLEVVSRDDDEVEQCFNRALEVARSQGALSLELRAATSLGRLWLRKEKSEQARRLLSGLLDSFTEGFHTADLQQARAVLDECDRPPK